MKTIYNEGRVVGLSAYESYVRQFLSNYPDKQPLDEHSWLASMIGSGNALIISLPVTTPESYPNRVITIPLPENSSLSAGSSIRGDLFLGDSTSTPWATDVLSEGKLITHPAAERYVDGDQLPFDNTVDNKLQLIRAYRSEIDNYMKIIDGIVIQDGDWLKSSPDAYRCDIFKPSLNRSYVRILIDSHLTHPVQILLTGFTDKSILSGCSGLDGKQGMTDAQIANGEFLGPGIIPPANKILFSVPPAYFTLGSTIDIRTAEEQHRMMPTGSLRTTINSIVEKPETATVKALSAVDEEGLSLFENLDNSNPAYQTRLSTFRPAELLFCFFERRPINVIGEQLRTLEHGLENYYVQMGDAAAQGIRLYVCNEEPTDDDIPEGSVGIGW